MAETRKITIEILNNSGNSTGNNQTKKQNNDEDDGIDLNKLLHPIRTLEKATVGKNVFINQAYQQAKQITLQTVNSSINRYFNLSEDYMTENTYRNTITVVNKAKGLATSVIGGAMVGGPVGAFVAGVSWFVGETMQNRAALSSYYQAINEANYATNFSRVRAGLVDNGRGTEN